MFAIYIVMMCMYLYGSSFSAERCLASNLHTVHIYIYIYIYSRVNTLMHTYKSIISHMLLMDTYLKKYLCSQFNSYFIFTIYLHKIIISHSHCFTMYTSTFPSSNTRSQSDWLVFTFNSAGLFYKPQAVI